MSWFIFKRKPKGPSPATQLLQLEKQRLRDALETAHASTHYFRTMHRHLADMCFSAPDDPALIEVEKRAAHEVAARFPNAVLRRL